MSVQTQEVRTKFVWDTGDVDRGVKRMETALDRLKQAENGKGRGGGHGNDNNFAMGIRDLAEGRGVNAMQRFGHTLGATAARLSVYMVGLKAAGEAMRNLREEIEQTNAESRQLEIRYSASARMMATASGAQKPDALTTQMEALKEGSAAEDRHQVQTGYLASHLAAMRDGTAFSRLHVTPYGALQSEGGGNPLSMGIAKAFDSYNEFMGNNSPEQELENSKNRKKDYGNRISKLRDMRSESFQNELATTRMQGPGENPYAAKRHELEVQLKLEESQFKSKELTEADQAAVRERYAILLKTVTAEETLLKRRQDARGREIEIQRGPQGAFGKSLGLASERIGESMSLRASGLLNEQQQREEGLKMDQQEANRYQTIQGRYLNADGSRRRAGDINRDFRRDRREERQRARFQRAYDRGGFDPVTGRRRTTGDAPGGGLHTGGLRSGGLRTGGLGNTNWRETFPAAAKPAGADTASSSSGKTTTDLYTLLDQRLPNQTA